MLGMIERLAAIIAAKEGIPFIEAEELCRKLIENMGNMFEEFPMPDLVPYDASLD